MSTIATKLYNLHAAKAVKELNALDTEISDNEAAHCTADDILLTFIRDIGYPEVADAYNKAASDITFWYS